MKVGDLVRYVDDTRPIRMPHDESDWIGNGLIVDVLPSISPLYGPYIYVVLKDTGCQCRFSCDYLEVISESVYPKRASPAARGRVISLKTWYNKDVPKGMEDR